MAISFKGKKESKEKKTEDRVTSSFEPTDMEELEEAFNDPESSAELRHIIESDPDRRRNEVETQVMNLMQRYTVEKPTYLMKVERGHMDREDFLEIVRDDCRAQNTFSDDLIEEIVNTYSNMLWSYGVLNPLIDDPDISDIRVVAWNKVRVKRKGHRENAKIRFTSEKFYQRYVDQIAIKNHINISEQNAISSFVDKDSHDGFILRFNITMPFINSVKTPYLTIRKVPKQKYTLESLMDMGMMDESVAAYLEKAAADSDGILFTGKGASGKTSLMNCLLDKIPQDKSGLVIQENEELFSTLHGELMFQHTVINNGEGRISYELKDLARNGLLLDLDYFIIGEIKGAEALYFLNAAYTGHQCWASVHGASATEAINKLVDYIKYESDYTREDATQMLTHLKTIVFMKKFKVSQIAEIQGFDREKGELIYKEIMNLETGFSRLDQEGNVL